MAVAILASLACILAAVFVYNVPGDRVIHYLLMMLILLVCVMALAAVLVLLRVVLRKLTHRQD